MELKKELGHSLTQNGTEGEYHDTNPFPGVRSDPIKTSRGTLERKKRSLKRKRDKGKLLPLSTLYMTYVDVTINTTLSIIE